MKTKTGWFWGILLVLAAAAIIAVQVVGLVQVGFWSLLATVLLLAILVGSLLSLAFTGVTLSLACLYLLYQQALGLYPLNGWILVLAALIGGIGLSVLVRPLRHKKHRAKVKITYTEDGRAPAAPGSPNDGQSPQGASEATLA